MNANTQTWLKTLRREVFEPKPKVTRSRYIRKTIPDRYSQTNKTRERFCCKCGEWLSISKFEFFSNNGIKRRRHTCKACQYQLRKGFQPKKANYVQTYP